MSSKTFKDKVIEGIENNAVSLAFMLGGLATCGLAILQTAHENRHPTLKDVAIVPDCAVHKN